VALQDVLQREHEQKVAHWKKEMQNFGKACRCVKKQGTVATTLQNLQGETIFGRMNCAQELARDWGPLLSEEHDGNYRKSTNGRSPLSLSVSRTLARHFAKPKNRLEELMASQRISFLNSQARLFNNWRN